MKNTLSSGEETLAMHLQCYKVDFVREFVFAEPRKFRFDFALPNHMIAIEVEGAIWKGGRHSTGKGMSADMEKYNLATILGWRLLRFSTDMVVSGVAIDTIVQALHSSTT